MNRCLFGETAVAWETFVAHDSRLQWLYTDARAQVDPEVGPYCRIRVFEKHFLPRISILVGPESVNAHKPLLGSSLAFDYVCDIVKSALPPCRDCEHDVKKAKR